MIQASSADARLIGAWNLVSWQIFSQNSSSASEPFGPTPVGLLQYSENGWMSAAVSFPDRVNHPAGVSPRRMQPDLLANSYRSYFHYAGLWHIDGDCVIHSVRLSLNPNMIGSEQVRQMTFDAETLTLQGQEAVGPQQRRHVLLWQRATSESTSPE
jgi:hypothetical protein